MKTYRSPTEEGGGGGAPARRGEESEVVYKDDVGDVDVHFFVVVVLNYLCAVHYEVHVYSPVQRCRLTHSIIIIERPSAATSLWVA